MLIISHRGAGAPEPENTRRAILKGISCADYVEVDVRLSRDNIPVIIHDARLDRTTSGTGRVNDLSLRELRQLDAGDGEKISTLEEICSMVSGKCGIFVEIKEQGSERTICSVLEHYPRNQVYVVSFHEESLRAVREYLPDQKTGFIYSQPEDDPVEFARVIGADVIVPRLETVSDELVASAHASQLLVFPWLLNKRSLFCAARELKVDGIITDNPCSARSFFIGA